MMNRYFVYILASKKNGTLYIGSTNNLHRRIFEHKSKLVPGFTKKYDVTQLVHYEIFEVYEEAVRREKRLKNWNRSWKINLIEENNSSWRDLYSELGVG